MDKWGSYHGKNASCQLVLDAEMQPAESAQEFWPALQKVASK